MHLFLSVSSIFVLLPHRSDSLTHTLQSLIHIHSSSFLSSPKSTPSSLFFPSDVYRFEGKNVDDDDDIDDDEDEDDGEDDEP